MRVLFVCCACVMRGVSLIASEIGVKTWHAGFLVATVLVVGCIAVINHHQPLKEGWWHATLVNATASQALMRTPQNNTERWPGLGPVVVSCCWFEVLNLVAIIIHHDQALLSSTRHGFK